MLLFYLSQKYSDRWNSLSLLELNELIFLVMVLRINRLLARLTVHRVQTTAEPRKEKMEREVK